ncbi:hypothetical protein [Streptomyces sp. WAC08241]|uniref:hypothetical protein n=1 Tax=Streptomyces sp. WAC08241 TaxID=2487421 RepID=UPI0021AE5B40|nr:hypothetical protein [Streptomyces sp. WAC08241]
MAVQIAADTDPERSAAVRPTVLTEREELDLGQFPVIGKEVAEVFLDKPEKAPAFHERVLQEHARG